MTDFSALMQYAVVAFASLFILVDPLATAPLFIVMTADDPPDKRRQMARRAAGTAFLALTGFALFGDVLLRLFSLTLSAFRIAGGIILFGIALVPLVRLAAEHREPYCCWYTSGLPFKHNLSRPWQCSKQVLRGSGTSARTMVWHVIRDCSE